MMTNSVLVLLSLLGRWTGVKMPGIGLGESPLKIYDTAIVYQYETVLVVFIRFLNFGLVGGMLNIHSI